MDLNKKRDELADIYTSSSYFSLEYSISGNTAKECNKAYRAGFDACAEILRSSLAESERKKELLLKMLSDERDAAKANYFKLESENKELEKALEFYADRSNWLFGDWDKDTISISDRDELSDEQKNIHCGGKLARQTLSKLRGGK